MTDFDLYADENKPVARRYGVVYRLQLPHYSLRTCDRAFVYVTVGEHDIIEDLDGIWFGKRIVDLSNQEKREVYDWLVEWEFAVWRRIGPEDSELFATERLCDAL